MSWSTPRSLNHKSMKLQDVYLLSKRSYFFPAIFLHFTKQNHHLQDEWKLKTNILKYSGKENELTLGFGIPHGRYFVKQQYYLHDFNSFIADAGGYLGLLLGHSALGLIYMMVESGCVRQKTSRHR